MKTIFAIISLAICGAVAQSDERSLTDTNSESAEGNAVLAIEKLVVENRRLREELEDARKTAAGATAEAEVFKRQLQNLTQRMEALGASTANPSTLEQRVLQAANALRHSEAARDALSKALLRLAQIAGEHSKGPDAESKLVLETELKRVDEVLTKAIVGELLDEAAQSNEPTADLTNGKVSAIEPKLGCIVINLGAKHGVKVGMPFHVKRGDKLVATVRVVDARQAFAGTVIQNQVSEKDPIKLGDTVRVAAQL
jgi:hypothetical protein